MSNRGTSNSRGNAKPKAADVWALRKADGGSMQRVFERWGSQWSETTLKNLSNLGRLEEAAKEDDEIET